MLQAFLKGQTTKNYKILFYCSFGKWKLGGRGEGGRHGKGDGGKKLLRRKKKKQNPSAIQKYQVGLHGRNDVFFNDTLWF